MSCTPANRQTHATRRKRIPAHVREGQDGTSGRERLTAPAAYYMVCKVLGTIHTNNKSDEVRAHHHQNVEDSANSTAVAIPPLFAKLHTENRKKKASKKWTRSQCTEYRGSNGARTIEGGSAFLAITSGKMKSATSQPHAKSLGLRSCQRATNVKINTLVATSLCAPPSGM